MQCPDCGHDNLSGADACADCGQDLTSLDTPGQRTEIEVRLTETPVSSLAPRAAAFVAATATVRDALERLKEPRLGAVLIGSPERVEGIFSERDVLLRVADRYEELMDEPVSEVMTAEPETVEEDDPLAHALHLMSVGDFRHLPVTRAGRHVGLISIRDVVSFLSETYPDLIPAT